MRSFVSALLVATALAQSNSTANSTSNSTSTTTTAAPSTTDKLKQAVSDVTNWLLGKTKENLGTDSEKKPFNLYDVSNTTLGLTATFSLDNTALGVNFVTAKLDVSGFADRWANGTAVLTYFQVEQPVPSATNSRLLQASNSTANSTANTTVVTGTGNYEGWSGAITLPLANNTVVLKTNKNSWGKKRFTGDNQFYTSFGGVDAVNTNSSSAWQLSEQSLQTFTAANGTTPGVWSVSVWRLASAVDSLKFKFVPDQEYYFQAGTRFWAAKNTAAATQSRDSSYLSFTFDSATTNFLGLGAVAASIAMSMF